MPRATPESATLTFYDHGLVGRKGARTVLDIIRVREDPLLRLDVGHNDLGDEGVTELVKGLLSYHAEAELGLCEISLMSNSIGNLGAYMISRLLLGIETMTDLYLAHNDLDGEDAALLEQVPDCLREFFDAVAQSNLLNLSLTNNRKLGSSAVQYLFNELQKVKDSEYQKEPIQRKSFLQELHLNMVGADLAACQSIARYLSHAPNPTLRMLGLNANVFGLEGVRLLGHAIAKHNSCLVFLEFFANEADDQREGPLAARTELAKALARNRACSSIVQEAALNAIMYGRTLLNAVEPASDRPVQEAALHKSFPYLALPREVQIAIYQRLSDPADVLSSTQWRTLMAYAMDRSSLQSYASVSYPGSMPTSNRTESKRSIYGDMRANWQRREDGTWTGKLENETTRYEFLRRLDCHVWRPRQRADSSCAQCQVLFDTAQTV